MTKDEAVYSFTNAVLKAFELHSLRQELFSLSYHELETDEQKEKLAEVRKEIEAIKDHLYDALLSFNGVEEDEL